MGDRNKSQTMNVALSPVLASFVREKVESGYYASASEVIRAALRMFAQARTGETVVDPAPLDSQEARIDRVQARAAIAELRRLRTGTVLGPDVTVRQLIDEGRR